ncbi:MAG: LAGLIDADG family homing endonuclease, partial [Ktedonobacterales bacterium]
MAEQAPTTVTLKESVESDLRAGGALAEALPGYDERPAQIEMARRVATALETGEHLVVEAGTGTGKALDVDTPIPTPSGWKRIGELVVGDNVFDETGHPTGVTAAFNVLIDRTCYEIAFSDGSTIVADADHQWVTYTSTDRRWAALQRESPARTKNFVTRETLDALDQHLLQTAAIDPISAPEAVILLAGHHWTVGEIARGMLPVSSSRNPARYSRQALLAEARSRLARDLVGQRRDKHYFSIVTTEQMAATLTVGSTRRANHAVPVAGPLSLPDAELLIDPYFLGVWLGDGSSRSNQIVSADTDILREIEKAGYTVRSLPSHRYLYAVDDENGKAFSRWQPGMTGRLRSLELILNKHIPTVYLRSSEEQRRALLAGLLDTDGTVSQTGAVELTTTSPRLAQDAHELACSLGFRPSLREGRARLNGKDCGPKWTLNFTTDRQVFRLPRKAATQVARTRNYSPDRNGYRYVVSINHVSSRPVRCIQVDAPSHLYLAGRSMIPTHNSLAYLLPIVRSEKVALISTANKNLQEQLFYKDIPFVQQYIKPFQAALVKGMGNYLCLDRLEEEQGFQEFVKERDFTAMLDQMDDSTGWD